eukprot:XP_001695072.1 predicted protein [Chlamydomonas reinhardtii]
MHQGSSTLFVARLPLVNDGWLAAGREVALVRPHPLLKSLLSVVDSHGILRVVRLGEGAARSSVVAAYELQLSTAGGFTQPVAKAWSALEHQPDDGVLLSQAGSGRIMFAQLPLGEGEAGPVFLFGSHEAPVLALASTRELLLSGGADGCVRLWSLDTGAQIDSAQQPGGLVAVTAVAFVGPLMAAAGTDRGDVAVLDCSGGRLEAVARFRADAGPVSALAARVSPRQAADVAVAEAPRGLDGGGVLPAPVGLSWRDGGRGATWSGAVDPPLLAVASTAGWLHVFSASATGTATAADCGCWVHAYAGAVSGQPHLSFSPDGRYLAVASGAGTGRLLTFPVHDAGSGHGPQRGVQPGALDTAEQAELQEGQDFLDWLQLKAGGAPAAAAASGFAPGDANAAASPGAAAAALVSGDTPSPMGMLLGRGRGQYGYEGIGVSGNVGGGWGARAGAVPKTDAARAGGYTPATVPLESPYPGLVVAARGTAPRSPLAPPTPRSWITGLPPRPDLLPAPLPPQSSSAAVMATPGHERLRSVMPNPVGGGGTRYAPRGSDSGVDPGLSEGLGDTDAGELPHTGTLLPVATSTSAAAAGRYAAAAQPSFEDYDQTGLPDSAAAVGEEDGEAPLEATAAGVGHGEWRRQAAAFAEEAEAEEQPRAARPPRPSAEDYELATSSRGAPSPQAAGGYGTADAAGGWGGGTWRQNDNSMEGGGSEAWFRSSISASAGIAGSQAFGQSLAGGSLDAGDGGGWGADAYNPDPASDEPQDEDGGADDAGGDAQVDLDADAAAEAQDWSQRRYSPLEQAAYLSRQLADLQLELQPIEEEQESRKEEAQAAEQAQEEEGNDDAGAGLGTAAQLPSDSVHVGYSLLPRPEEHEEQVSAAGLWEGFANADVLSGRGMAQAATVEVGARGGSSHRMQLSGEPPSPLAAAAPAGAASAASGAALGPAIEQAGWTGRQMLMQLRHRKPPVPGTSAATVTHGGVAGLSDVVRPSERSPAVERHKGSWGGETTPGQHSPARSRLQSPGVLLGSPSTSATGSTMAAAARRAEAPSASAPGAAGRGAPAAAARSSKAATSAATQAQPTAGSRMHLAYLRQQRQQHHQARVQARQLAAEAPASTNSTPVAAATGAGSRPGRALATGRPSRNGRSPTLAGPVASESPLHAQAAVAAAAPSGGVTHSEDDDVAYAAAMQADEDAAEAAATPGALPQFGATALLLRKMEGLRDVLESPPPVHYVPAKAPTTKAQLDPRWVASRQQRPEMWSLWRPAEVASEVCNTRGVAMYTAPSAAEVARSLLRIH